jgi:hypothetical protein
MFESAVTRRIHRGRSSPVLHGLIHDAFDLGVSSLLPAPRPHAGFAASRGIPPWDFPLSLETSAEGGGQLVANFLPNTMEIQGFIRATGTKTRESEHLR